MWEDPIEFRAEVEQLWDGKAEGRLMLQFGIGKPQVPRGDARAVDRRPHARHANPLLPRTGSMADGDSALEQRRVGSRERDDGFRSEM